MFTLSSTDEGFAIPMGTLTCISPFIFLGTLKFYIKNLN